MLPTGHFKIGVFQPWVIFLFLNKNAIKHEKCPIFVYRAFFLKSLCSKNPIWSIFSRKIGHFLFQRGWQPWIFYSGSQIMLSQRRSFLCVFSCSLTWATPARSAAPRSSRRGCGGGGRRTAGKRPSKCVDIK